MTTIAITIVIKIMYKDTKKVKVFAPARVALRRQKC